MKPLLKYKHLIVSFGLLPILITLAGLHFFPNTVMLGVGLGICIAGLCYNIFRLKGLNFFLLQGTVGIGTCFFLRLLTGYEYIPPRSITPILEFLLLICAFVHTTAPEVYRSFLKRFRLNTKSSYLLETRVIVILSSLHLLGLFLFQNQLFPHSNRLHFFLIYCVPLLIYAICLLINIAGIQMAASHEPPYCLIRVAPVCNGKIYLYPYRSSADTVWDLPLIYRIEEALSRSEKHALKQAHTFLKDAGCAVKTLMSPRLILKYRMRHLTPYPIQLFILPLKNEADFKLPEGRFFDFHEMEGLKVRLSKILLAEKEHLQISADVWNTFTCK